MLLTNVAQSSPGLISEKNRTLAEGLLLKVESLPKERQERKRKKSPMKVCRSNSKPGTDRPEKS